MEGAATLTAENFEAELLGCVPEVGPDLSRLKEWWGDGDPGLHIVAGDVLAPHVIAAVEARDDARLRSLAAFMERMATGSDDLQNVLNVSVLERLGDDRRVLETVRAVMGPATLACSRRVETFWGREP